MRKLASIQEIKKLETIPEADKIVKATVLGWELVVLKDEFKVGDKCIYIEIDSVVPEREEFEFLRCRKFRIKTIKLKGQVSQGLALPLNKFLPKGDYKIGDDVTELLGITKYDPQLASEHKLTKELKECKNSFIKFLIKFKFFRDYYMRKNNITLEFPDWIDKTDEARVQTIPEILELYNNKKFIVTEKLEGMSATFFVNNECNDRFGVCSRNLRLFNEDNDYWKVAKKFEIKKALSSIAKGHKSVVLQGEIIGESIQCNIYDIKGKDFYAFNLIIDGQAIDSITAKNILSEYGIKFVPIIDSDFKLPETIPDIVDYSIGQSVLSDVLREGIVIRNYEEGISFKVINPEYLLKSKL